MKTIDELEKHDGLACEYGYNVKVIPLDDAISFAKRFAQQQVSIAVEKALTRAETYTNQKLPKASLGREILGELKGGEGND